MNKFQQRLFLILGISTAIIYFFTSNDFVAVSKSLDAHKKEASCCNFLALGRQGYGNEASKNIADAMGKIAEKETINAVFLLGDNFYPVGVKSVNDEQWFSKFENLYKAESLQSTPFYAVLGNHDYQGNPSVQLSYSIQQLGSQRWKMDFPYYVKDFGELNGFPIARVVFLDSLSIHRIGTQKGTDNFLSDKNKQLAFLEEAFQSKNGTFDSPVWKIIVSHYPVKSETENPLSEDRVMSELLPVIEKMNIDLVLSANDRFQQVLQMPNGTMHVSANGGGEKLDQITEIDSVSTLILARRGFVKVDVNPDQLNVYLYDEHGQSEFLRIKTR